MYCSQVILEMSTVTWARAAGIADKPSTRPATASLNLAIVCTPKDFAPEAVVLRSLRPCQAQQTAAAKTEPSCVEAVRLSRGLHADPKAFAQAMQPRDFSRRRLPD